MGWTFLGFEAAGSIAEEVHDPAKNVPRAIVGVCVGIGVCVGVGGFGCHGRGFGCHGRGVDGPLGAGGGETHAG